MTNGHIATPEFTSHSGGQVLFFDLLEYLALNLCQCHEEKRGRRGHCFTLKGQCNGICEPWYWAKTKVIKDIFGGNGNLIWVDYLLPE